MANVLIIDDDQDLCRMLGNFATSLNHRAACAGTLAEGVRKAHSDRYEIVLLDVGLPDGNGLDGLSKIRQLRPSPEVIMITGNGDRDGAEVAIRNGAWDYIQKPLVRNDLVQTFKHVLQYRSVARKPSNTEGSLKLDHIVGSSPPMEACYNSLARAAGCHANVLITGETGTGKELFAQAIHRNSSRADNNFVVVDCTALPENLVESTLFGHEKGAFTGADRYRQGLIKQADGGTLFLDEVGELPLPVQRAFLRVLEHGRFRPVGGQKELTSDFRLVAATNRNLDQMVQSGQFRQDLLYRLRSVNLELPPLRARAGDVKKLADHYMDRFCQRYGINPKVFSTEFFETLEAYPWPGNVRELVHAIENVIASAGSGTLLIPQHLPKSIRSAVARASVNRQSGMDRSAQVNTDFSPLDVTLKKFRAGAIQQAEKVYLQKLMAVAGDDIQKSCRMSGLSRPRLYALLKQHQISRLNLLPQ